MRGELAFGTIDTWLVWNLTHGETHVTDPSNASRTLLFDIRAGDWDDELLALFDIPARCSRASCASSGVCAERRSAASRIPIAGIAGDQQAAPLRAGLPCAGPREEHVRDRVLPADEHRAAPRSPLRTI
jgi:glycerol kinase